MHPHTITILSTLVLLTGCVPGWECRADLPCDSGYVCKKLASEPAPRCHALCTDSGDCATQNGGKSACSGDGWCVPYEGDTCTRQSDCFDEWFVCEQGECVRRQQDDCGGCNPPQVCMAGACRVSCSASAPCGSKQLCLDSNEGAHCVPASDLRADLVSGVPSTGSTVEVVGTIGSGAGPVQSASFTITP